MKPKRALILMTILVLLLCTVCGVWLHRERQQYARSRALIDALTHNDAITALALVNEGADPNTRCAPTPAPSMKLLLDQLLHHRNLPANNSPTALMLTCGAGWDARKGGVSFGGIMAENLPLLQMMLAHGADVRAKTSYKHTALHFAADGDRLRSVELLLKYGADVNAQDNMGHTPLMVATGWANPDAVRLLLLHGANPNVQEANGNTALYFALYSPRGKSLLPPLLAGGADPNLRNKSGTTPIQVAQHLRLSDLVRLLKGGAGR